MKDAIRRRGENISSFEVEQVLLSHPDVGNAAVFPVPSELAEDEVMAAIVRRAGQRAHRKRACEFCRPRLARFAVPRFIEFVDDAADDRERQGAEIQAARPRRHRESLGSRGRRGTVKR